MRCMEENEMHGRGLQVGNSAHRLCVRSELNHFWGGDERDCTSVSRLLTKIIRCSELHCWNFSKLKLFLHKVGTTPFCTPGVVRVRGIWFMFGLCGTRFRERGSQFECSLSGFAVWSVGFRVHGSRFRKSEVCGAPFLLVLPECFEFKS